MLFGTFSARKVTVSNGHLPNKSPSKVVTDAGMVTDFRPLPWKQRYFMVVRFVQSSKLMLSNLGQLWKAKRPRISSFAFSVTLSSLPQL